MILIRGSMELKQKINIFDYDWQCCSMLFNTALKHSGNKKNP